MVGAYAESSSTSDDENDNSASQSGAVYMFTRNSGIWTQKAYIKASNVEAGDGFGYSVDINQDSVVIGANFEDSSTGGDESDNSASSAGAAYVWE